MKIIKLSMIWSHDIYCVHSCGENYSHSLISQHCVEINLSLLQTLNNQAVTYAADLWALGCVMYQMLVGKPPFKAGTEYLTFQLISAGQVDMPSSLPSHAQDLLRRLLLPDASKRLGQTLKLKSHCHACICLH